MLRNYLKIELKVQRLKIPSYELWTIRGQGSQRRLSEGYLLCLDMSGGYLEPSQPSQSLTWKQQSQYAHWASADIASHLLNGPHLSVKPFHYVKPCAKDF